LARIIITLYKHTGIYGSNDRINKTSGNVIISSDGAILKNTVINGDLYLTSGIGGDYVTLDTVNIKGKTMVSGGGKDMKNFVKQIIKCSLW
jgi:hypothetical protein